MTAIPIAIGIFVRVSSFETHPIIDIFMACVYILYSLEIDSYYVGSCLNFENRFEEHLNHLREKAFTSRANDWKEYLKFEDLESKQSHLIEKHIKKMKSRVYLENLKQYPELRERLLNQYI